MALVLSGEAPQERRKETVSSDADRAASISGVVPFLVSGCKETMVIMMIDDYDNDVVEDHPNLLLKRWKEYNVSGKGDDAEHLHTRKELVFGCMGTVTMMMMMITTKMMIMIMIKMPFNGILPVISMILIFIYIADSR